MQSNHGRGHSLLKQLLPIGLEQRHNALGGHGGLFRDFGHSLKKESEPALPIAIGADPLQGLVVLIPMGLEIEAQVEEGLFENALVAENERDEEAPQSAIPVQERMDG